MGGTAFLLITVVITRMNTNLSWDQAVREIPSFIDLERKIFEVITSSSVGGKG